MSYQINTGDVISVSKGKLNLIDHQGVVSRLSIFGDPTHVIAGSQQHGHVVEQSIDEFSDGQPISHIGYPSHLPPSNVLSRARSIIGTPYDLFKWNCEHVVRAIHDLEVTSPQLRTSLVILALTIIAVAIIKS